jgi:ParB family chromosome partitioning protein
MVNPLEQIRNRQRARVAPRPDPLSLDLNAPVREVALSEVKDRAANTRELNLEHVARLVTSISEVGLITPLTLDREGALLAGAHRLEALRRLSAEQPERFETLFAHGKVPARVMNLSATRDTFAALRVEIEENEHRLDYSVEEVCAVAEQLISEGYVLSRGRPKQGERPLIPALELIFNKSRATIKRYLAARDTEPVHTRTPSPELKVRQVFKRLNRHVTRGARELSELTEALDEGALTPEQKAQLIHAQEALKALSALLASEER